MEQHTIQVSENIYQSLLKQAARLQTTPARVIERLLTDDVVVSLIELEDFSEAFATSDEITESLAAVQRLTTLFADINIPGLEEILNDPMLALVNMDIGDSVS